MKLFWKIFIAVWLVIIVILGVRFLSGSEDTWLCQNGQWIKHGQPSAPAPTTVCGQSDGSLTPTVTPQAEIEVFTPVSGQTIKSSLTITGKALNNWFFEAVFPISLIDNQGKELAFGQARSIGDWTTEGFIPFQGEINYQAAATTTGKLVFKNDNPSGLPQNEKSFAVPVVISPNQSMAVKAFFSNNNLDKEITCTKVFAVERQAAKTVSTVRVALEELLKGPSGSELAQGFYTSINPGVKIQELTITDGTAKVDFDETLEKGIGGSCRVSAIRAQITETLKQFSTVKNVIILVNGRIEDILQP